MPAVRYLLRWQGIWMGRPLVTLRAILRCECQLMLGISVFFGRR